ncbi:MAG: BRCT domain-containing protein, partial [Polyangiaceae bacterium]
GTSFCVTGVLSKKREDIHSDLRAAGAAIFDSVKKGTTYLVAGEKTGKSKLDQAKKFGTRVISEDEMQKLIAGETLPELAAPEPKVAAKKEPREGSAKKSKAAKTKSEA